ncbi:hypothetical protein CAI21_14780 [Alkalilimnicola ehrlichii]|uniref:DUF3014 domain-containing protein n=1 Tax=Alkalilimnicola ehrlichii TaxID=351052 RepID=UPI000E2E5885|nr:DUF3014 domain-containing protein [Alkalilimnicola ehrlichii]RFA27303.1 hypothetical protein CAI21_14780 [Alkalilimnicola ehrlichii]
MKKGLFSVVVVVLLVSVGWWLFPSDSDEDLIDYVPTRGAVIVPAEEPVPQIRHPVPELAQAPGEEEEALPELDESDPEMERALAKLVGDGSLELVLRGFVRRVVVTVDNLPNDQLPQRFLPARPVEGEFATAGEDETLRIASANFERYRPVVENLEALDTEQLVAAYVRYYPLFQKAYEEIGFPEAYFNNRLIEVIDHLLETPLPEGELRLVQPSVRFRFADRELESLSAGQKVLLRMGPENAERIKAKLREVRAELVRQPAPEAAY